MADTKELADRLNECAEKRDFAAAFGLVRENLADLAKALQPEGIKDALVWVLPETEQ